MGRSFESVRMGVKEVSARWAKTGRALKKEDQVYAMRLSEMAKKHSSEAFYAMDDPLEAAVFSVLVEMLKEMENNKNNADNDHAGQLQAGGLWTDKRGQMKRASEERT